MDNITICNCSNCFYYRNNLCKNFKSPLSYENVNKNNSCKEWEKKKNESN